MTRAAIIALIVISALRVGAAAIDRADAHQNRTDAAIAAALR